MNKQKQITFVLIFLLIVSCFIGCNSKKSSVELVIGVNQYVTHPILDAVFKGFSDEINKLNSVKLVIKNANADAVTNLQINEKFISDNVDIIVALGTPSAQSAVNAVEKGNTDIPIVFGAITDPVGAKLADSLEKPGGNKTGTTDQWPYNEQVLLIKRLFPNAKNIGVLVNPAEENCESGMKEIRKSINSENLNLLEVPISNSADIKIATNSLKGKVDVIIVSPSNLLYSALDAMMITAEENDIPVVGGDEMAVKRGSIATYGFDMYNVGVATAKLVLKVHNLNGKAGIIPVAKPEKASFYSNTEMAAKYNVALPQN